VSVVVVVPILTESVPYLGDVNKGVQTQSTFAMISCSKVDFNDEAQGKLVVELLNVYATDIMGGGESLREDVKANLATELRKRPTCHTFIARLDDIPAGVAICFEGFSTFECKPLINVHDLCVVPSMRRKGVASSLVFAIEQYAQSIGCCKLTLEVLEGNHAAKSTYRACGFEGYELDPDMGKAMFWQKKLH
jgi:GNAT superfamily N-acetyltransferase